MTIQEFFRHVPLDNSTRPLVIGNGYFNGRNVSNGQFVVVDRNMALNLPMDYELLNVTVFDGHLWLEVNCQ